MNIEKDNIRQAKPLFLIDLIDLYRFRGVASSKEKKIIRFINETDSRIEISPFEINSDIEFDIPEKQQKDQLFMLESGESVEKEIEGDMIWNVLKLPTLEVIGHLSTYQDEETSKSPSVADFPPNSGYYTARIVSPESFDIYGMMTQWLSESIIDKSILSVGNLIEKLRSNFSLLTSILCQAPKEWFSEIDSSLFKEAFERLSHLNETKEIPFASGDSFSRKRGAFEANLLGVTDDQSLGMNRPKISAGPNEDCESPFRAHIIELLNRLTDSSKSDLGNELSQLLANSLVSFNAFESEAALSYLSLRLEFLNLESIINSLQAHGYLSSAPTCLESLLRLPIDEQIRYQQIAFSSYRISSANQPKDRKETKIGLETFLNEISNNLDDPEKFSQEEFMKAATDILQIKADQKSESVVITGCTSPNIDGIMEDEKARDFMALVDERLNTKTAAHILNELCPKLPRLLPLLAKKKNLVRRFIEEFCSSSNRSPLDTHILTVLKLLVINSESSRSDLGHNLVEVIESSKNPSRSFMLVRTLLLACPRLIPYTHSYGITGVVLEKLTMSDAKTEGLNDVLSLFQLLISRECREIVDQDVSQLTVDQKEDLYQPFSNDEEFSREHEGADIHFLAGSENEEEEDSPVHRGTHFRSHHHHQISNLHSLPDLFQRPDSRFRSTSGRRNPSGAPAIFDFLNDEILRDFFVDDNRFVSDVRFFTAPLGIESLLGRRFISTNSQTRGLHSFIFGNSSGNNNLGGNSSHAEILHGFRGSILGFSYTGAHPGGNNNNNSNRSQDHRRQDLRRNLRQTFLSHYIPPSEPVVSSQTTTEGQLNNVVERNEEEKVHHE